MVFDDQKRQTTICVVFSSISIAHKKEKDADTHSTRTVRGWVISERMHLKSATLLAFGQRDGELVWEGNLNFTACCILPLGKKSILRQLYSFFRKKIMLNFLKMT